ncbi:DUF1329 domain-containing protein [Stenotrophobium rhamnosiphilum]|uniref:DUF1329 domain-containing protein n=1 Tax=Stenotrophobium rhamnosiphilum TaxID=2029166 RepID=A0A2T5MEG4_9GAMM|nr:DUF1329 domain-containing protein [Stenotrophobium rhamnosiphilum]PTU30975.1 DUF1329 domain-containing protein [Stenotrophobium rhamnosiphilum]
MSLKISSTALALALSTFAFNAHATATAAEAAKLCNELTCVGAVKAGNKDGTIPEWTGPSNFSEEQKTYTHAKLEELRKSRPKEIEDLFAKQAGPEKMKILFTVTKANMAQYADKLTEGQKAMLKGNPNFKMNVYKSVRTAFFPDAIYKATVANATSASLTGTDVISGAKLGFPFPIPKTGAEVIWNHKLKFRGSAVRRYNNQAIVKPDGTYTITKLIEDVKFKYANLKEQGDNKDKLFGFYLSEAVSPPRVAGQITLVHETAGGEGKSRSAWIYSPGLGRVNRAPDVGYDNPAVGTDNEQFTDQIDVFNGALDRYNWKLIGKKEMYIAYNSYKMNSPLLKYKDILTPYNINPEFARYELHRVWVVEASLKPGMRHNFAKRVFYVDEDSWAIAAEDCYDGRGTLWKVQEAHLLTAPFIPTVTGIPELIYDLQSHRYFATTMINEDATTDFEQKFEDAYFDPANLKRKARSR